MAEPRDDEGSGHETSAGSVISLDSPDGRPYTRPREDTPPAPCAAFCGPRTCNTLPPNLSSPQHAQATEPKRRRLWGLRGLVKMFRRRVRRRASASTSPEPGPTTLRARSTSELQVDQSMRTSVGPYNQGLSVSHDSVFSPDTPSGAQAHTPPALVIATRGVNMAELKAALRRRGPRGDDSGSGDDDLGLPRSPPTSPTTLDVLNHGLKSVSRATQSTCSDGSLLSMGSSENDEDSLGIGGSHHSSNLSLLESRQQVIGPAIFKSLQCLALVAGELDHEPVAGAAPLNHQAARHKMSLKPKRTYATPRSRKSPQAGVVGSRVLPVTPEVNEESLHKNQTPPQHKTPSSSSLTSSPLTISSQNSLEDSSGIGSFSNGSGQEPRLSIEVKESEKKVEEKKDESIIGRFFGSVRRKTSESAGEKSREGSPLQKESEQKSLKEKRRDSSGSRFQLLGRSSSRLKQQEQQQQQQQQLQQQQKQQQQQHEQEVQSFALPPTGRGRDTSRDRKNSQDSQTSSNQQSHRSASVEGRLESTQQPSFRISSYEERPKRSHEVRKVKSFRELEGPKPAKRDWVHEMVSPKKQTSATELINRSASLDSLDDHDDVNDDSVTSAQSSSALSESFILRTTPPPLGKKTSIDSLTSTNIPGVFIRQQSGQSQTKHKQIDQQQVQRDNSSGPLSLDSSISVNSKDSEESLRNAVSVDHMVKLPAEQRRKSRGNDFHTDSISIGERRSSSGSKIASLEKKTSSSSIIEGYLSKSEQTKPSGQAVRSPSIQKSPDELENDKELSKVPLKPVKREKSLKRVPSGKAEQGSVPEFMRIQLNRVENKGHTTVFDTEQESPVDNTKEMDTSMIIIDSTPSKDYQKIEILQEKPAPLTKENKSMGSLPKEKSTQKTQQNNELIITGENHIESTPKKSIPANRREDSFHIERTAARSTESINIVESNESISLEPTSVVLRRPLVTEKALLDRAQSVSSPSPVPSEQPELFKVFARRSFKDKSSDKDKDEEAEENDCAENASEVSELTITQSISPVNSPGSVGGAQPNRQATTSLNAISFNNRMSVGNPTLSFRPPPQAVSTAAASVNSSPSGPSSPPVVVVLSHGHTETSVVSSPGGSNVSTTIISTGSNSSSVSNISGPGTTQVKVVTSPAAGTNKSINYDSSVNIISEANSTYTSQVSSKIISNSQFKSQTSINESTNVSPSSSQSSNVKPLMSTRNSSSNLWPPRNQQQDDVSPKTPTTPTPGQSPQINSPLQQTKGSVFTAPTTNEESPAKNIEDKREPVEESPLDISAARRRFMSGGNKESQISLDKTISTHPSTPPVKSSSSLAEARNTAPTFTITVRTQQPSGNISTNNSSSVPPENTSGNSNSVDGLEESNSNNSGVAQQVAEDWRVLARQRRNERRKSTKTADAEELLIETRPPASRNSKVLEMASNFQKLQVA